MIWFFLLNSFCMLFWVIDFSLLYKCWLLLILRFWRVRLPLCCLSCQVRSLVLHFCFICFINFGRFSSCLFNFCLSCVKRDALSRSILCNEAFLFRLLLPFKSVIFFPSLFLIIWFRLRCFRSFSSVSLFPQQFNLTFFCLWNALCQPLTPIEFSLLPDSLPNMFLQVTIEDVCNFLLHFFGLTLSHDICEHFRTNALLKLGYLFGDTQRSCSLTVNAY